MAGLALASTAVHAQVTLPFISASETLAGGAGKVNVVEVTVEDPNPFPVAEFSVGYFVDVVAPGVEVGAFAVSFSDPFSFVLSARRGWSADSISALAWDMGVLLPNGVMSTSIGAYASFFEASSAGIAFFTDEASGPIDEFSDSDIFTDPGLLQFGLGPEAEPSSNTLIFAPGGAIIDGSTIPEPSGAILGLVALCALLRRRR